MSIFMNLTFFDDCLKKSEKPRKKSTKYNERERGRKERKQKTMNLFKNLYICFYMLAHGRNIFTK